MSSRTEHLSPQQIAQRSHFPRRLPRDLVVPRTSLYYNLQVSATRYPDKPAAIYCGKTTTYAELHAEERKDLPVRDGDRDVVQDANPGKRFGDAFYGDGHQRGRLDLGAGDISRRHKGSAVRPIVKCRGGVLHLLPATTNRSPREFSRQNG